MSVRGYDGSVPGPRDAVAAIESRVAMPRWRQRRPRWPVRGRNRRERERAVASRRRPGACRWSSGAGTPRSARCREDVGKLCIVRSSGFAHGRTLRTLQALNRRSGEHRPVFIYAAADADRACVEADYDGLLELHAAKLAGTSDVALVTKDADGRVKVEMHDKPTQHGAWAGIPVGAAVGVLAAPAVIPAALVGGISAASAMSARGGEVAVE